LVGLTGSCKFHGSLLVGIKASSTGHDTTYGCIEFQNFPTYQSVSLLPKGRTINRKPCTRYSI
jgi:hypothetical protein